MAEWTKWWIYLDRFHDTPAALSHNIRSTDAVRTFDSGRAVLFLPQCRVVGGHRVHHEALLVAPARSQRQKTRRRGRAFRFQTESSAVRQFCSLWGINAGVSLCWYIVFSHLASYIFSSGRCVSLLPPLSCLTET